jgi:hypothetical protein
VARLVELSVKEILEKVGAALSRALESRVPGITRSYADAVRSLGFTLSVATPVVAMEASPMEIPEAEEASSETSNKSSKKRSAAAAELPLGPSGPSNHSISNKQNTNVSPASSKKKIDAPKAAAAPQKQQQQQQ